MKKILLLMIFTVVAIKLNAQTPKAKVDTAKKQDNMPMVMPSGNMPMRVIVPKYNAPMPVVRPDSNKAVTKPKTVPKTQK